MIAYVHDEDLRQQQNDKGWDYWDIYVAEICSQLGASATRLSLSEITPEGLNGVRAMIVGALAGKELSDAARAAIDDWVGRGGLLIGFGTVGLDHVFGIETFLTRRQPADDYTISGYFNLLKHRITHQVHPHVFAEQKLVILSDVQLVRANGADTLAWLFDRNHDYLEGHPALAWNRYGQGFAGYFAFDVAKTMWVLHQGRPLRRAGRSVDMAVLGKNLNKVAYADELAMVLQNMLAFRPEPLIHQIPPSRDGIPDALLFWGGDCCAGDSADFVYVSNWMKEHGLPYHLNICYKEDGSLNLDAKDAKTVRANGHELSLHYKYAKVGYPLSAEGVAAQVELFEKTYGATPVCTVPHGCAWYGGLETAKWMAGAGVQADNCFAPTPGRAEHLFQPNGPAYGMGFGTVFPFHFYDDAANGNARIDFIELPIVCYELGHRGSIPPYDDKETMASDELRAPVDRAVKYHQVMNVFYHPVYIAQFPPCRAAIEDTLDYIKARGYRVLHLAPDALVRWWQARDRSSVSCVVREPETVEWLCRCEYEGGMVVKYPLAAADVTEVLRTDTSEALRHKVAAEFGNRWLYVAVPTGETTVRVGLRSP